MSEARIKELEAKLDSLLTQGVNMPAKQKLDKNLKKKTVQQGNKKKIVIVDRKTWYVPGYGRIFKSRIQEKADKEPAFKEAVLATYPTGVLK